VNLTFFSDVFTELSNYGEIEELNVCDNIGDHMVGNVYCKYFKEEDAERAMNALMGRFYDGVPVTVELSPVTDFREAHCRQYEMSECKRGGYCNFMHLKPLNREIARRLFEEQRQYWRKKRRQERGAKDRERSRSRERDKEKEIKREKSPSRRAERKRSRSRSREREKRERSRSN